MLLTLYNVGSKCVEYGCGMIVTGRTGVYGEKHVSLLLCPLQAYMIWPKIEPELPRDEAATNHLSHGTAAP